MHKRPIIAHPFCTWMRKESIRKRIRTEVKTKDKNTYGAHDVWVMKLEQEWVLCHNGPTSNT